MTYRGGTRSRHNGRHARESADIKVLADLRVLLCPARYRHAGPYGPGSGFAFRMLRRASETRRGFDGGGAFGKRLWMQRRGLFRSIRTLMSIDKRVSPFFKVRKDLNSTGTAWRNPH